MSNDDALARELVAAGVRADDRTCTCADRGIRRTAQEQLRRHGEYRRPRRRALTAAAFLGKFTQGMKWAHLDIAGVAYQGGANKGSTGRPTAMLSDFLIHRAGR